MSEPEPTCTCHRSGSIFAEPEFECDVHGLSREDKAKLSTEEHARMSAMAILGVTLPRPDDA